MRFQFLLSTALAASVLATPVPQGKGKGSDSCAAKPLEQKTWTDLKMDDYLSAYIKKNFTASGNGNKIQTLANTFGAPNFFCGLNSYCNAGQPCLPVQVPGWYAMVAIQNWNTYMNSINTAVNFASTILSLKLPGIVNDFLPKKVDNVTPLKNIFTMFNTVLGAVPLVGPIGTAKTVATTGAGMLLSHMVPPAATDKFVAWSDISGVLAGVVTQYHAKVTETFEQILHADPLAKDIGIAGIVSGGNFLGVAQNFTQAALQKDIDASLTRAAIGAAISASGVYVMHFHNASPCVDNEAAVCQKNGGSNINLLLKHPNYDAATDVAKTLSSKYGLTKEDFLTNVAKCWTDHGKTNKFDAFKTAGLPHDAKAACVLYIPVCDYEPGKLLAGTKKPSDHCAQAVKN
ncbi:hypothetical protein VTL71DRAFT_6371 [Oculimacula yallundae]|uniref:DUF7872 domain-containing protein n=1 Tax=Oculimacula yallundae TaxID=86028 RepID=A0ABR4BWS8_9HELO